MLGCSGSSPRAPGKQTTAQESSLERAISVHAAAAKTRALPGRVEPWQWITIRREYARRKISLESAEGLSCEDRQPHGDQWTRIGIENAVRLGGANQPVADVPPRAVDRHDLRVFAERIVDLAIAGSDQRLDRPNIEQRFVRECVHPSNQVVEPSFDNEI